MLISSFCNAQNKNWDKLLFGAEASAIYSYTDIKIDKFNNKFVLTISVDEEEPRDTTVAHLYKYNEFDELVWSKKILEGTRFTLHTFILELDDRGNIYFGVSFIEQIAIDGYLFKSKGETDGLLLKADGNGNLLLAKQFGGSCNEVIRDIEIDEVGNIYFGGQFGSTRSDSKLNCDLIFEEETFLTDANLNGNYFLVKLNKNGELLWHHVGGGSSNDGLSYIILVDNRIYFSGSSSSISYINLNGYDLYMTKQISYNMFFAMVDALTGETIWANVVGNSGALNFVRDKGIAATKYGVSLTGYLHNEDSWGGQRNRLIIRNNKPLEWEGSAKTNYFVLNYDTLGNLNWAKKGLENVRHNVNDILVDSRNNTYVLGFGGSRFIFANDTITNNNSDDAFLTCYDSDGEEIWIKIAGGYSTDRTHSMTFDRLGRIYISGTTNSDTLTFGDITSKSPHTESLFYARLSDSPILNVNFMNTTTNKTTVYPNPAIQRLWLQQSNNPLKITNLFLYDVSGKLIKQNFKTITTKGIEVNFLSPGIYFLKIIYNNGENEVVKWCKQ